MASTQTKVVIADYDYDDVEIERAIIEAAGFELVAAHSKTEDEVIEVAHDAAGIIAQYAPISARVIAELPECRVIARYGTGVDVVDVAAATEHNIVVTNVPNDWCENEVADHAMALLLALSRKITVYDRETRAGIWQWQSGAPIHVLRGSTLGLLSFGAIARAVAARASAFGMQISAHDPFVPADEITATGAKPVSFDELVTESDCIVIQAPLTPQTYHMFDETQLRRMKPTSILINTGRGPIVDDRALHRALSEGWIAGAALDDIEEEPSKIRDWQPDNPLFSLDNVVITPHAAFYSEESLQTVRRFPAEEVVRVISGQAPLSPVNADDLVNPRWSRSAESREGSGSA
jgi:D-3-phosphoglycerate dehydrogenase / 2-oxoglutarate reductase